MKKKIKIRNHNYPRKISPHSVYLPVSRAKNTAIGYKPFALINHCCQFERKVVNEKGVIHNYLRFG